MDNRFFEQPILNSPYLYPQRHWELDENHQPTQNIVEKRRPAEYITPIPKPRKQKRDVEQRDFIFNEGLGLSTAKQQYDPTSMINDLRKSVDGWRKMINPNDWHVTPETTLKAQIDEEAWESLHSDVSRPFPAPLSGRIAVKVINHLGDEVMKVFRVR